MSKQKHTNWTMSTFHKQKANWPISQWKRSNIKGRNQNTTETSIIRTTLNSMRPNIKIDYYSVKIYLISLIFKFHFFIKFVCGSQLRIFFWIIKYQINMFLKNSLSSFVRFDRNSIIKNRINPSKRSVSKFKKYTFASSFLYSRCQYNFSAVSIKDMKVAFDPSQKTQIISLNQEQLQQLATIVPYMTSIAYLEKNELHKSLQYLQFAISQARANFPQSINLHMCLLNRKSILHKLLSQNDDFLNTLEEIFLIAESLKGLKNLQTQKHLSNYLLSLLFYNREKMAHVIEYVQSLNQILQSPKLEKKLKNFIFFDSIADIFVRNQPEKGFQKLQTLPEETFQQKYFKTNNVSWMKYIHWKMTSKSEKQFSNKVKEQGEELLKKFLRTLFDMEYCVPDKIQNKNQDQTPKNAHLIDLIKGYLVDTVKELRFIPDNVKLGNPQSPIVTMNISNLLFDAERLEECVYFMKLSLSSSLDSGEVERVGVCLLLLAKISQKGAQNYDEVLLGMLQNSANYPVHIIKECLSLYSQFLFKEGRFIEAENYANQMMKLEGDVYLEGLLLPDYDFSY